MKFKEWLQKEEMTSTSCIASFPMRWGPIVRRSEKKRKKN